MKTETRQCQNCKNDFNIEQDDFSFYEKMKVPPPKHCPRCRQQFRTVFRNFKTLYKRPSDKSKKQIVSIYKPHVPFPVYDIPEWWADDWDPTSYAIDLNLGQPLFAQIADLF